MNLFRPVTSFTRWLKHTYSTASNMSQPILSVQQGKLKGAVKELYDGSTYYSFKGIPYAEPPVGKLRFKSPQPPKPWNGVFEAIEHGSVCPQFDVSTMCAIEGDENCLFLNVYTKSLEASTKLPVMVFIHGGGFMSGSGDELMLGPDFLLQHDVILVTFNYRLEALGFLCLDIPEVPGNAGMRDQVAALRWVQNNISQFGGDPNNVTIFGESAGGASVTYHMMSPMSKGLFHKAITQSGVCIDDWARDVKSRDRAFRLGKLLGKETNDPHELLEYLQSVPSNNLINVTLKTSTPEERYRGLPFRYVPTIEKKFNDVEAFLDEDPITIMASQNINKVPLIIGHNSREGIVTIKDRLKKADSFNENPSHLVPRILSTRISEEKLIEFGVRIKKFYVGDAPYGKETAEGIISMQSDIHFMYSIHRFVHFYSAFNQPVFMYKFGCDTELNLIKTLLNLTKYKGACHAEDLFYLFSTMMTKDTYLENEKLRDIVFRVTKLWADFAKSGNPTPDNSLGVQWTPYTLTNKAFLDINEQLKVGLNAQCDSIDFWNKLYSEAGVPCGIKSSL